jgi:hypothetical protein
VIRENLNASKGYKRPHKDDARYEAMWTERFPGRTLEAVTPADLERVKMEGVDLLTTKELGGWRSLSMVSRFAHLSPSHRSQALERLVTRATTGEDAPAVGAQSHRD